MPCKSVSSQRISALSSAPETSHATAFRVTGLSSGCFATMLEKSKYKP